MTTQFDDVVKDAKRSAKEEIAELLKRQNGSSTVIDKLIKAVSDIHHDHGSRHWNSVRDEQATPKGGGGAVASP